MKCLVGFWLVLGALCIPAAQAHAADRRLALIAVRGNGVASQLLRRVRSAVLAGVQGNDVDVVDLVESHDFVADCDRNGFPVEFHLRPFKLTHTIVVRVGAPEPGPTKIMQQEIRVEIGRLSGPKIPAMGPWSSPTICRDCADSEIVESAQLLAGRAWKATLRAETPMQEIRLTGREKADRGASIFKATEGNETIDSADYIYAMKKAAKAGSRQAYASLARKLFNNANFLEAEEYGNQARAMGATEASPLLAMIDYRLGRWPRALTFLEETAKDEPKSELTQQLLEELRSDVHTGKDVTTHAEEFVAKGDWWAAGRSASIGVLLNRSDSRALILAGEAESRDLNFCNALAYFSAAVEAAPTNQRAIAGKSKAERGLRDTLAKQK